MAMLRRLADAGRVIVVATYSLTFLDGAIRCCSLAPGGKAAFFGPLNQPGVGDGNHRLGRHLLRS